MGYLNSVLSSSSQVHADDSPASGGGLRLILLLLLIFVLDPENLFGFTFFFFLLAIIWSVLMACLHGSCFSTLHVELLMMLCLILCIYCELIWVYIWLLMMLCHFLHLLWIARDIYVLWMLMLWTLWKHLLVSKLISCIMLPWGKSFWWFEFILGKAWDTSWFYRFYGMYYWLRN